MGAQEHRLMMRRSGYPAEIPGWEHRVRSFLHNKLTWGTFAGWDTQWTNNHGRPRCARCGTTNLPDAIRFGPRDAGAGIPACIECRGLVDGIELPEPTTPQPR